MPDAVYGRTSAYIYTNALVRAGALVRAKVACTGDLVAAVLAAEPAAVQELLRRLYTAYCLARARGSAAWPAQPARAAGAPPGASAPAAPDAAGRALPSLAGACRSATCCYRSFRVGQESGVTCKQWSTDTRTVACCVHDILP